MFGGALAKPASPINTLPIAVEVYKMKKTKIIENRPLE
jgi:hypothetical protein